MQALKKEKKVLEEKADKFDGVVAENRKLIKEKAMRFNSSGDEIKKMNDRIMELQAAIFSLNEEKSMKEKEFRQKEEQFAEFYKNYTGNYGEFPNMLEV